MKLFLSPAAQADLMDIAAFIAQDNPTRALSFVYKLDAPGPSAELQMANPVGQPERATRNRVMALLTGKIRLV